MWTIIEKYSKCIVQLKCREMHMIIFLYKIEQKGYSGVHVFAKFSVCVNVHLSTWIAT